ncbi:MAG: endonuclease III [Leptospiraceae bacterium]|nr:endonuclease III [Leptospiraceae bacterium]
MSDEEVRTGYQGSCSLSPEEQKKFIRTAYRRLNKLFGPVSCPLHYNKPHELCIAVILSAQCTDEMVNRTTPALFAAFPELEDYASSPLSRVEELIHSTGFYRNKARNIQGFARKVLQEHDGQIPETLEELTALPGVGRKTANVVLQELYDIPSGVVVDTHVARISNLFKLTRSKNPVIIERDLMTVLPQKYWIDWSLYMIFLGRSSCTARKRHCEACVLGDICPSSSVRARKSEQK